MESTAGVDGWGNPQKLLSRKFFPPSIHSRNIHAPGEPHPTTPGAACANPLFFTNGLRRRD
jgi:hypothetical protein